MPVTRRIKIYKFSELSKSAQTAAIYNRIGETKLHGDIALMKSPEYESLCDHVRYALENSTREYLEGGTIFSL